MLDKISSIDRSSIAYRYDRNDVFRLVSTAHVDGTVVHDELTEGRLAIDPLGAALVMRLAVDRPPTLGSLAHELVLSHGMPEPEAFRRVTRYLDALDRTALVERIAAPTATTAAATAVRTGGLSLFVADWFALARGGATHRYPPTMRGLTSAVARTQWIVPAAGIALAVTVLAVTGAMLGPDQVRDSDQVRAVILSPLLVGLVHVALFWIHEAGHLLVAHRRADRTPPHFVVARGRKVGIVRRRGNVDDEVAISVSGPLGASAAAVAVAAVAVVSDPEPAIGLGDLLVGVSLLLGVGHLLSLAPFAADGHNIVAARRRARGDQP